MLTHNSIVLLNYISVFIMFACAILISNQTGSKMQKFAQLISVCLTMSSIGMLYKAAAQNATAYLLGQKIAYAFIYHGLLLILLLLPGR